MAEDAAAFERLWHREREAAPWRSDDGAGLVTARRGVCLARGAAR
jgi:hypothetical protein